MNDKAEEQRSAFGARYAGWWRAVVAPRLEIARLLQRAGALPVLALTLVNVALGLLPVLFVYATSLVIGRIPGALGAGPESRPFHELVEAFVLASGSFLGQQGLAPVQSALGEALRLRVDGQIRDATLAAVTNSRSVAAIEDKETLDALGELTRLLDTGWNTPGMACAGLLSLVARYLRLGGLLVIVGSVAGPVAALAVGCSTGLFRVANRGGLRKYSAVWREVAGLNRRATYLSDLATGASGAKELRIFGLTRWLTEHFRGAFLGAYAAVARRRRQIYLRPFLLCTPIGLAIGSAVIAVMARDAAGATISIQRLTLGVQATMAALMLGEFYAEADVPTQFGMQAMSALDEVRERIARLGPLPERASSATRAVAPSLPERALVFEAVGFEYPRSARAVLRRFDLELPAGRSTAIVGANGAGKTTLVKLLTRLYEPTSGSLRADGIDIATLDAAAWRRQVSVVFQDFVRYELSAADNIALGAAHIAPDRRAIEWAAEQAGIGDVLHSLSRGVDTPLARAYDDGVDLSGGQWQRIAIARSLYALRAGAKVLILDEPTAALDVRAEAAFFDRFLGLTRGATSILISHRLSSVRHADRIV
ncbi:MAG TPA: ATP-binding cassette domain-containing protein, partial [Polyangiaceae bacterium]|nr:ATP-binding cassette domain-containing protein [Polyangiaceae bacterium]